MRTPLTCAPLCAFTLLIPAVATAQTTVAQTTIAQTKGADQPIVITANRAPASLDQVGQSVTVIDQRTIEASQAIGVTELIAQTPGVQFRRNGGRGTATSVFIRGADTGQTVVLYDGVRLHDPSAIDASASLTDVMTGDIGRIEVLRGVQSVLYGSQAIGGVINIVTQQPSKPFEASLQAEAGELDSYLARASIGGKAGALVWRAGAGYTTTDGISAYSPGTETDGYENLSLNGRLEYSITDDVSLDLRSFYSEGDAEFDGFNTDAPNRSLTDSWLTYAGLNFRLFERLDNRIAYARTDIARLNLDETTPANPFTTFDATGTADRFEYQGTLAIQPGSFAVFGVDYAENQFTSSSFGGAPTSAMDDTLGLYAQATAEIVTGLTLNAGLRHEDHSTFGGDTVFGGSLAYSPNDGDTVIRASFGEGFKTPSLFQLFSSFGNPALAPEQAESWDVGVEHTFGDILSLSAVYFDRDTAQLVDFVSCSADPANPLCDDGRFGFYDNVGLAKAKGVELAANVNLGPLTASANYTYLDATNETPGNANRGNQLARRAQDTFTTTLGYTAPFGLIVSTTISFVGDSFNNAGNTQLVAGYTTVDLRASYPITEKIELYARAENLFDEDYETVRDFGTLPRLLYAGVRLRL